VRLTLELLAALYIMSFVCFWCLCRAATRSDLTPRRKNSAPSNLIPFERGVQVNLRKTARSL
jgi:hypothetical protein